LESNREVAMAQLVAIAFVGPLAGMIAWQFYKHRRDSFWGLRFAILKAFLLWAICMVVVILMMPIFGLLR